MKDRVKKAFDSIHAEEKLIDDTAAFLKKKIQNMERSSTERKNHRLRIMRLAAVCASLFVLVLAGAFSYSAYFTEAAYVDVDINPALELAVNRFGRVIGVYAYNLDGEVMLERLDIMHKPYGAAVDRITEAAIQTGFLSDGGLVSVTVQTAGEGDDGMLSALRANIATAAQAHHVSVRADVFYVDDDTRTHAHGLNLSPAKYLAILELQAVDPTATVDECREHSIGQIRKRAQQHAGAHQEEGDEGVGPSSGEGHGKKGAGHHGGGHE